MRIRTAALLLALALAPGCGGEGTTDPNELTPLTEEQKREIQERDAAIQDEEGGELAVQPKSMAR